MKTRAMRSVLVAAALVLAAVAVLVGPRRSAPPHVTETHVNGVPHPASGLDADPTPRPDLVPPVGTSEVAGRTPAPASLPATEDSPELYATGTASVTSEPPMEAPTSSGPELHYDEAPAASPYDSPTGSQSEAVVPQLPVDEPYDRAPTDMPSDASALSATEPAVGSQRSPPTEAPPY